MSDDLLDLLNSKVNRKKPAKTHDDTVVNSSTLNPAPLSNPERVEEPEADQSPFTVMVDDNYHYMDGDSRYTAGKFDTWEEAVTLAKKIVDETISPAINDGLSPEGAVSNYRHFGEDPWIIGNGAVPEGESFSAWSYAEEPAFQLYALKNRIHEEKDNE
jgi:hypothetical protein